MACGHGTYARVAHKLGSILSSVYTHGNISLGIFRLCCVSIGLDTNEYETESEGAVQRLPNIFDTPGRLESLGYRSLSELASLHGFSLHSTPDRDDALDIIVNHFLSGECTKTNNIF